MSHASYFLWLLMIPALRLCAAQDLNETITMTTITEEPVTTTTTVTTATTNTVPATTTTIAPPTTTTTLLATSTAVPTANPMKDDLTTAFARKIIKQAKAADIKSMLNTKISPCDDFYQYACGNWARHNPAQLLTNIMTDRFQAIGKAFKRRLQTLLTAPVNDNKLENNVKDFYRACQLAKHDDIHYKLGLENVYREFGKLPMLEGSEWNETEFNWWQTVAKIQHKYGKDIILSLNIMGDVQNNTLNKVYLGPPDYEGSSNTQLLRVLQEAAIVKNMKQYIGLEHSVAKQTAKEMIAFERVLMEGGADVQHSGSLQELLTLRTLQELNDTYAEHINIEEFLELLLGSAPPDTIYIYNEQYLQHAFKTIAAQPKRIVANYIYWQLLQLYFVNVNEAELPKWCIDKTKKYFGKYIDYLVYQSYKSNGITKEVHALWKDIKQTFKEELAGDKLDWISNSTREYAIEKLQAMELIINSYEDEDFTQEYGALQMDRLNFVQNLQQMLQQASRKKLQRLQEPAKSLEATEIVTYTPAYNLVENNIRMPVSILQPHFLWDANYPQALKYATLGYLMAHEMIHGFDDEGRNYDKNGNLRSWWDAKSTYEFESRRKCFQAQYHSYSYGGAKLPETIKQSENIADNAAVKFAYKAYVRWLNKERQTNADVEETVETLPGLGMSNRQLFFTSFAQVWCGDVQTLFKSTFAADVHAPGMYRVIGTLSNFQEFSWVFNCPQNAPMDPEYKCAIY